LGGKAVVAIQFSYLAAVDEHNTPFCVLVSVAPIIEGVGIVGFEADGLGVVADSLELFAKAPAAPVKLQDGHRDDYTDRCVVFADRSPDIPVTRRTSELIVLFEYRTTTTATPVTPFRAPITRSRDARDIAFIVPLCFSLCNAKIPPIDQ
jgi:hypothetical protein